MLSLDSTLSDKSKIHEKMRLAITEGILRSKDTSLGIKSSIESSPTSHTSITVSLPDGRRQTLDFRALLTTFDDVVMKQGDLWKKLNSEMTFSSLQQIPLQYLFQSFSQTEIIRFFRYFESFKIHLSHPVQLNAFLTRTVESLSQSENIDLLSDDLKLDLLLLFIDRFNYNLIANQSIIQTYLVALKPDSFADNLSDLEKYISTLLRGNLAWNQLPFESQKVILQSLTRHMAEFTQLQSMRLVNILQTFRSLKVLFHASHRPVLDGYIALLQEIVTRSETPELQAIQVLTSIIIPHISQDEVLLKRFSTSDRAFIAITFQKQINRWAAKDTLKNLSSVTSSFIEPGILRRLISRDLQDRVIQSINRGSLTEITEWIKVLTAIEMSWKVVPALVRKQLVLRLSYLFEQPAPSDSIVAEQQATELLSLLFSLSHSANLPAFTGLFSFQSKLLSVVEAYLPYLQDLSRMRELLDSLAVIGIQWSDMAPEFQIKILSVVQEQLKSQRVVVTNLRSHLTALSDVNISTVNHELKSLQALERLFISLERIGFDSLQVEEDFPKLWRSMQDFIESVITIRNDLRQVSVQKDICREFLEGNRLTSPLIQSLTFEIFQRWESEARKTQTREERVVLIPAAMDYLITRGFSLILPSSALKSSSSFSASSVIHYQSVIYAQIQHYLRLMRYQPQAFVTILKLLRTAGGVWKQIPHHLKTEMESYYCEMIESDLIPVVELVELTNQLARLGMPRLTSDQLHQRLVTLMIPRNQSPTPEEAAQLGNRLYWLRVSNDCRWFNLPSDIQEEIFIALSVYCRSSLFSPDQYLQALSEIVKLGVNISTLSKPARTGLELGLLKMNQQLQQQQQSANSLQSVTASDNGVSIKNNANRTQGNSNHPYSLAALQQFTQLQYSWSTFSSAAKQAILSMIRRDLQNSLHHQEIVNLLHCLCLLSFDCQPELALPIDHSALPERVSNLSLDFHETHRAIFRQWWSKSQKSKQSAVAKDSKERFMSGLYYHWFPMLPTLTQHYLSNLLSVSRTPNPVQAMNSMRNRWQEYIEKVCPEDYLSQPPEIPPPLIISEFLQNVEDEFQARIPSYLETKSHQTPVSDQITPSIQFKHYYSPFPITRIFPVALTVICNGDYLAFVEMVEDHKDLFYEASDDRSGYLKRHRILQKQMYHHYFPQASFHFLPVAEVSNRPEVVVTSMVEELLQRVDQRLYPNQKKPQTISKGKKES